MPAVLVGSLVSSTVPDRFIRPVIAFAILASGLKYVGLSTSVLGWALCGVLLAGAVAWLVYTRPWNRMEAERNTDAASGAAQAAASGPDSEPDRPGADTVAAG